MSGTRSFGLPVEFTSYVGRGTEIREVTRLLGVAPLVTLTGAGGVGKTRLAAQVASTATGLGDVVYVGLAELREPNLLVNTIGDRLGLGDQSTRSPIDLVVDHLRTRRLLLVLDNCEHLVEACARFVSAVLTSCPEVVVLATSRQSLGVAGEQIMPVPPLAVPEPGESPAALDAYDAVRLFRDRAVAVVPSFTITEDNVDDVIRLCRALDGLPLAIELAAVRLRSLSAGQLADRLNKRFTLLTRTTRSAPSRHETLSALIDWSHQLCTAQERLLWARASVFSGSFHLDAAESVCCGDGLAPDALLDVLDGLIDKSILLRVEHPGQVRYRMLETIRQYGEDQLRETGDLDRLRRRHRDWCLELTSGFAADWFGPAQLDWMDRVDRDHANLRQALDFCARGPEDAVVGLHMATDVKEFWLMRGLLTEGRMWCRKLSEVASGDSSPRAVAGWVDAFLGLIQGDKAASDESLAVAEAIAERIGDASVGAYVVHMRAYAALMAGIGEVAADLFGESAARFHQQGDLCGELWATCNYGLAVALKGDLDHGRLVMRDCVDRYVALGEVSWRCWALWSLCAAEYLAGDIQLSIAAGREVLRLQQLTGDRAMMAFAMTVLAGCATQQSDYRRAARLLGAASQVWRSLGASPDNYAAFVEPMRRDIVTVTTALGETTAAAEFTAGAALATDVAVAYARGEEPLTPEPVDGLPLTRREMEVAQLVAQGMTNREIASRLVISLRTAETHIDHIRTKLGFNNRAQIAAWVAAL
ncbi:ATP-binding protein [Actinokineospora sp. HUAS TT18]|uniref:ATP-binding protein n=1 Tax=Actinokineospora sp. HUAS TT18 TaxID=3447451 RepID=UPI003F51F2FF